jgi:FtsH-binding integral membrane protein
MTAPAPTVCPKCGHARGTSESAPVWQCPACGVAYQKYHAYLERARKAVTPLHTGDAVPGWSADSSVWSLLAANAVALAAALHFDWSANSLMLVYWIQSVVIGISYFFRILSLDRFSTENFQINDRPVAPTPETKRQVASFFAMHYGLFHAVYFMFLILNPDDPAVVDAAFWICAAAFAFNHLWSYRYNRDLDRQGTPNIGTLMFTPYLRIIPMHLTIIFGGQFIDSTMTLLLFGGLKTLADVGMHLAEHARLRKVRTRADHDSAAGR